MRFKANGDIDPDGFFMRYADHAAALAAMTERAERAEKDRDVLLAEVRELRPALERAEKANAVLRAECEAWREFEAEAEERSWSKAWPVHADWIADAQNATDAAGALKGVE